MKILNENKKIFSKIGANYLILAIMSIIFQILLIKIVYTHNPNLIQNMDIRMIISALSNYILPLPIIVYLMHKIKAETIEKESLTIKKFLLYICITITLMWIGNVIGNLITLLLGYMMSNDIANPIEQAINNSSIYINFFVICIMAPIFEEIFFRKLLVDRTIQYGATLSIFLSATIFGLFHGNLSQFFYAFLLGGFFAYVYIKTGKIIYSISLHVIINIFGSIISTIFNESLKRISAFNPIDITIVAVYMIILFSALIIGLYAIMNNYNKIDLKEIYLEKPAKTVFLNVGMILFILFETIIILKSLNIITFL